MWRVSAPRRLLKVEHGVGAFPKTCVTLGDKVRVMSMLLAKPFDKLPRIRSLPLVGTSWLQYPIIGTPGDPHKASWELYRRYGPVVVEENPGRETIVHLFNVEDFRFMFRYEGKMLYRSGLRPLKPYIKAKGDLLPDNEMEEWGSLHSWAPHPTFEEQEIEPCAYAMGQTSDDTLKLIDALRDDEGEVSDWNAIMEKWSLESAMFRALNTRLGLLKHPFSEDSDGSEVLRCTSGLATLMDSLAVSWRLSHRSSRSKVKEFNTIAGEITVPLLRIFREAISEAGSRAGTIENDDILQRLQEKRSFYEMLPYVYEFLVANTYMASAAATFCLYRLAMHPEAQEKARREVLCAVKESKEYLPANLPYLYACIKESLRLHPMVHEIYKRVYSEFVASDHQVPPNTLVRAILPVAGQLEKNFPKASEFLPERWLRAEESEKIKEVRDAWTLHQFAYVPFNLGPGTRNGRRFIELELLILLAKVLRKYKVENHHGDIGFQTKFLSKPQRAAKFRFVEL